MKKRKTMRQRKTLLSILAIAILGFAFSFPGATEPLTNDKMDKEAFSLDPWAVIVCSNDFIVENRGDDAAELTVIFGDDEFVDDRINAKEKRFYSRKRIIALAKSQGKNVEMDDVVTVINMDNKPNVKLQCLE